MKTPLVQPHGTEAQKHALALSFLNVREERSRAPTNEAAGIKNEGAGRKAQDHTADEVVLAQNLNFLINSWCSPWAVPPGYVYTTPFLFMSDATGWGVPHLF